MRTYILALGLTTFSTLWAGDRLVGGPYVVMPSARSATIGWVVETGNVTLSGGAGDAKRAPVLRSEKVSVTGLKAGEWVKYEIPEIGDTPVEARQAKFKAPPGPGAAFQFVIYGDTRTRHALHAKIVAEIIKQAPEFIVHTGDLVADGNDTAQWPVFFNIEKELLRNTVFFPVLGNHERNNARFYEFFDIKAPYYSFNWGSAHFSLLASDLGNIASGAEMRERFWQEQTKWLEEDLQRNAKAAFRFVVMHHPPYTAMKARSQTNKEALALVPLFEKHKVSAVFAGHDHNYQRHEKNGVTYIVTGGGGAPLYPTDQPIEGLTKKVESIEHFVTMRVEGKTARLQVLALGGKEIDSVELTQP